MTDTCPNCGYCPHCKRPSGNWVAPYYPYWSVIPPYQTGDFWTISPTTTGSTTATVTHS